MLDYTIRVPNPSPKPPEPLTCIAIILCEAVYKVEGRSNLIIVNTLATQQVLHEVSTTIAAWLRFQVFRQLRDSLHDDRAGLCHRTNH